MAGNKTADGIHISDMVRLLSQLSGVTVRQGNSHPYIAVKDGPGPCPIAASSDARRMIVPWVRQATGYDNHTIYDSLRLGQWVDRYKKPVEKDFVNTE